MTQGQIPEPFQEAAGSRLNDEERKAFARCVSDWAREYSPEESGRMCACYFRGLRTASGLKVIDAALLSPWPPRSLVASTAFKTCIQGFFAQETAHCDAELKRTGKPPAECLCGSGGCSDAFHERYARRLGYVRLEDDLGNLKDAPKHEWSSRAEQRFRDECAATGRSKGTCGCLLKLGRVQLSEDDFRKQGSESILMPPNALRDNVDDCALFHDGPADGK